MVYALSVLIRYPDVEQDPFAAPSVLIATVTAINKAKAVEYTPPKVTATAPDEIIL